MSEVIELKITPVRQMFYNEDSSYGIYACVTEQESLVEYNKYGNFSIKGNCQKLTLENVYTAKLKPKSDKQWGMYYEIQGIFEELPNTLEQQQSYLECILTKNQVKAIYKAYPDEDIVKLVQDGLFDFNKVKGVGKKTYEKLKNKIIENFEFQEAFNFLSKYGVTNNLIIKLVKHFKSAGLLIQKMKQNPYCITEVSGVGFKKADVIAMAMGYSTEGKFRILSAIEFVLEDENSNGNTKCKINEVINAVYELIGIDIELISEQIITTDCVLVVDEYLALKKLYNAEKYISNRIKSIMSKSSELNIDIEKFIKEQEEKHNANLTDQQKSFFYNIQKHSFNVLSGFAGVGKSFLQKLLIDLLEKLNISYKLLAPTGKASKVLANYTGRQVETIHRAIGLGDTKDEEAQKMIEEEFIIVDETSMMDVSLCAKLLNKCVNKKVRILFIGDPSQIPSVGSGNVLHDLIESRVVPLTTVNIVFRQKEGGILDIATKTRLGEKFIDNDFIGIKEFGNNCTLVSVPQDKMEQAYKYYYNKLIEEYNPNDITIVTPTKKSGLGTVMINKEVQDIVNPKKRDKSEHKFGFDEVKLRQGDLVINTKNTYSILNEFEEEVNIVNGDIGSIVDVDKDEEEILVDYGFDRIPMEFSLLNQVLHAWCLTMHKMQGSSSKAIIAIADKAHKFQLNANLLYTAFTRPEERLVIISQADTINFALRKFANLQRNTFLKEMLRFKD